MTLCTRSKQWRPAVLYMVGSGVTTYNALRAALPPITDKTLASELVALVEHGLVVRIALREKPLRSRYELTERGLSLLPVLAAMKAWTAADRPGSLLRLALATTVGRIENNRAHAPGSSTGRKTSP